jgi:hypothetical protein
MRTCSRSSGRTWWGLDDLQRGAPTGGDLYWRGDRGQLWVICGGTRLSAARQVNLNKRTRLQIYESFLGDEVKKKARVMHQVAGPERMQAEPRPTKLKRDIPHGLLRVSGR